MNAPGRKQLVGLLTQDPQRTLEEGAQLMSAPALRAPHRPIGHVTSAYHSAVLERSIALALLRDGRARAGQTLFVASPAGDIPVQVTSPVFYDPSGARLNA
jgi:sarcosine oxidase subunit alpha